MFTQLFKELKDLSKKKPEATLSASKVTIINRVLTDVRECLEYETEYKYLDLLDDFGAATIQRCDPYLISV